MDNWIPKELRVSEPSRIDALADKCWVAKLGGTYFDYDEFARLILADGRSAVDKHFWSE